MDSSGYVKTLTYTQTGGVATVRHGSITNAAFTLEYATNVANGIWLRAAGPQFGSELFQELQDTSATNEMRFYRIVLEPVEP